jgi:hypothetical protein
VADRERRVEVDDRDLTAAGLGVREILRGGEGEEEVADVRVDRSLHVAAAGHLAEEFSAAQSLSVSQIF